MGASDSLTTKHLGDITPDMTNNVPQVRFIGVVGLPEIAEHDDLATMIVNAANAQGTPLEHGDILVVTQKVVSKAEGRTVDLSTVDPSDFARRFAKSAGRDSRLVELVLRESVAVVKMEPERGILITETRHGFVCANSGIDSSNVDGEGVVTLLPEDPDRSAQQMMERVKAGRNSANSQSSSPIPSDEPGERATSTSLLVSRGWSRSSIIVDRLTYMPR